jgi:CelD/BcsL family acetyltransferase involved in cellulose biosynthesis
MSSGPLRVELVADPERLRALEAPLRDLFARAVHATPFQSPDWWLPWAECFAAPDSLRVLVVWREARALACLPLVVRDCPGERVLAWLGEGLSDYLDVLLAEDAPAAALPLALEWLRELSAQVQRVELADIPGHSPLLPHAPGLFVQQPHAVCPALQAGSDVTVYQRALPHGISRTLRRSQQRLQELGPLRWQRADCASVDALLSLWLELHAARWSARQQPGVLADPRVVAFHRRAAPRLVVRGLLVLDVLWLGERAVAACYSLVRGRTYLYLSGYDPSLVGVSLGSVLLWHAISDAILSGRGDIDFLRGQEAYKYSWGARDACTLRLVLSGGPASAATAIAAGGAQAARGSTGSASPSNC